MRKVLHALQKCALVIGAFVVTVVVLELAMRVLGIHAGYHRARVDVVMPRENGPTERLPHAFVPYATVRSRYDSNPRGYFDAANTIDHVHNSAGWRDSEHSIDKPAGTYRILGLGDSYLWGQGVRADEICLSRVGDTLNTELEGIRVETINTAISATNTEYQLSLLRDRGLAYSPDAVIVHFVLNDVEADLYTDKPKIEFFRNYTTIYAHPDWLSGRSRLWGWARRRWLEIFSARAYVKQAIASFNTESEGWVRCSEALDQIQATCGERDIPLLVAIFPFFHQLDGDYPFSVVHDAVRGHCESSGIRVVDLREYYGGYSGPELWVHPTDQHPNEIAHGIAGDAIANYLLRNAEAFGLPVKND